MAEAPVDIAEARWPDDRADVLGLFAEYIASLDEDISFQHVDAELAGLPGKYALPDGLVLIARDCGVAVGVAAFRKFDAARCEMKRLYVRPAFRGKNLGRMLAGRLVEQA